MVQEFLGTQLLLVLPGDVGVLINRNLRLPLLRWLCVYRNWVLEVVKAYDLRCDLTQVGKGNCSILYTVVLATIARQQSSWRLSTKNFIKMFLKTDNCFNILYHFQGLYKSNILKRLNSPLLERQSLSMPLRCKAIRDNSQKLSIILKLHNGETSKNAILCLFA